ncbi:MAG: hypothetical protein QOI06_2253, partial [Nocardioidaceae bacterium]|nr:hypothetical protein [Nocardioidaceae bacterium]
TRPTDYSALLAGKVDQIEILARLIYTCGTVLPRHGAPYLGTHVRLFLVLVDHKIVVKTAYVE